MEAREAKRRWRREMRAELAAVDAALAHEAALAAADRVLELPEVARAERLLVCLSFGAELDTWEVVERLLEDGREIWVPRTAAGDPRLHLHRYPCRLQTLSFGLRQPYPDEPELAPGTVDRTLQTALVAGLAFDRRGTRLGYGAGYFDRFLSGRSFPAVGLCYASQLVDELPVEDHDVPVDVVVTESGVLRPGA